MAYTTIVSGTTITAAWANTVRDQQISVFTDASARDSAIVSPVAGMVVHLTTPDSWMGYDGTGWITLAEPRQSWTPSVSWTVGNGTYLAGYQRHDGLCTFDMAFTFGSSSAIASSATVALPFASIGSPGAAFGCGFYDTSATEFVTGVSAPVAAAGTNVVLRVIDCASTYARFAVTTGTIPFTWAAGDIINVSGTYRMNSRYL